MTPLKLGSFQQPGIRCSDLSVLSTITTDKVYSEFEQEFGNWLFLLNELKISSNETAKNYSFQKFFK